MIKLQDLLNELEKPKNIYAPGYDPEKMDIEDDEFLTKGYKLSKPEINPETGSSTSTVTYLPKFKQIRIELYKMRDQFRPFKYSSNPDIAKLAKDIGTNFTRLSSMILAIDAMIEAEKQKNV